MGRASPILLRGSRVFVKSLCQDQETHPRPNDKGGLDPTQSLSEARNSAYEGDWNFLARCDLQKTAGVVVIDLCQHIFRQADSVQPRRRRLVRAMHIVGVGNGTATFPGAFPER